MTLEGGGRLVRVHGDSSVVLDTGATANLVCPKWLANHNSHLQESESQK